MKRITLLLTFFSLSAFGQNLKAEKINFEVISNYESLKDSTTYSLNKIELQNLISNSTKKYTLLISYGFWCKPCQELLPKVLELINHNKDIVEIYIINVEPDESKRLFLNQEFLSRRFHFTKPNFMVSEDYGKGKWKKYDAFLLDIIGKDFNKTYTGMSQNILYRNGEIVYLSNYNLSDFEIMTDLKKFIER